MIEGEVLLSGGLCRHSIVGNLDSKSQRMNTRPLTPLRPMSDSLDCCRQLLQRTSLDVEAEFALLKGTGVAQTKFYHSVRSVIGQKARGFTSDMTSVNFLPFTISISGLATAEYLDERSSTYSGYTIRALFELSIRGIFTLDEHKLPTRFKGYASCVYLSSEWFARGGDRIGQGKANITAGTCFEDEPIVGVPPLFGEVENLQEDAREEIFTT